MNDTLELGLSHIGTMEKINSFFSGKESDQRNSARLKPVTRLTVTAHNGHLHKLLKGVPSHCAHRATHSDLMHHNVKNEITKARKGHKNVFA